MTAARAMLIAVVATSMAGLIALVLANTRPVARRIIILALAVLFLMPALMIGYAYGDYATLTLIRNPWRRELLYAILMVYRFMPVAVLVLMLAPRRMSESAVHTHRLANVGQSFARRRLASLTMWLRGNGQVQIGAAAVVFLLAFGEHEIASLLQIDGWTVWVFDRYVGGLPARVAFSNALLPMMVSLAVAMVAFVLLSRQGRFASAGLQQRVAVRRPVLWSMTLACFALLTFGLYRVVFLPIKVAAHGGVVDMWHVVRDGTITAEILYSTATAVFASVLVFAAAWLVTRPTDRRSTGHVKLLAIAMLCAVGLLGEVVQAFGLLSLFRRPALAFMYDTTVPLLVGLFIHLMPFALAWCLLTSTRSLETRRHVTRLYHEAPDRRVARWSRAVLWCERMRGPLWAIGLLAYLGYFTLTLAAVLSPSGRTPVTVTLYNLMHYGQDETLAAMVFVASAVPAVALGAGLLIRSATRYAIAHG